MASYEGQTLRLADLAASTDTITDSTFANCIIDGPGLVLPIGCDIRECTFEGGNADALIWEIPPGKTGLTGAVVFVNCKILACRFQRVGLALPPAEAEVFRAAAERRESERPVAVGA